MGFLDSLTWQLLGGSRSEIVVYTALTDVMRSRKDWLPAVVGQFHDAGLGRLVSSWVSTGTNLPATSHQIVMGLGQEEITEIAQRTGMSEQETAYHLSKLLPRLINAMTPGGTVPQGDTAAHGMSFLSGLLL
jgi:uncharacterized protein YidB (DUF937 family)